MKQQTTDLPLFNWKPPGAEVIPFPTGRKIGRIRHIVDVWQSKPTQRAKDGYWRTIVKNYHAQLQRCGVSEDNAVCKLETLFQTVQAEIDRRETIGNDPGY